MNLVVTTNNGPCEDYKDECVHDQNKWEMDHLITNDHGPVKD
jgi:hypothetical protein